MIIRRGKTSPIADPTSRAVGTEVAWKRAIRKFLRFFPEGFRDETYLAWERDYKWSAHTAWEAALGRKRFGEKLERGDFAGIAATAVKIESSRSLLFSFEKMALRDAVREASGARLFAQGLYELLHGHGSCAERFEQWVLTVSQLPRRQTRVLTWPIVTVFPFMADPDTHIFLKPNTVKEAARQLGIAFSYHSNPSWKTYRGYLEIAAQTRLATASLSPRDMIDVQSFLWVQGSSEYS